MTKIRPLGDKIVVKIVDETEQTSGGIFIPDSAREKPQKAEVVAVGPGEKKEDKTIELDVKVGEIILFSYNVFISPSKLRQQGVALLILFIPGQLI